VSCLDLHALRRWRSSFLRRHDVRRRESCVPRRGNAVIGIRRRERLVPGLQLAAPRLRCRGQRAVPAVRAAGTRCRGNGSGRLAAAGGPVLGAAAGWAAAAGVVAICGTAGRGQNRDRRPAGHECLQQRDADQRDRECPPQPVHGHPPRVGPSGGSNASLRIGRSGQRV
jgi:hypothetical protein